jgi:hypothetical protein
MTEYEANEGASPNGDTEAVETAYNWSETPPTQAVIEAVAIATNREPTDMDPLYDAVDPDALDAILVDGERAVPQDLVVSFTYMDCEVVLRANGDVMVEPLEETGP